MVNTYGDELVVTSYLRYAGELSWIPDGKEGTRVSNVGDVSVNSSETPFIDSLGPAPNAIILDILLACDHGSGVTRETITEQIGKLKQEREYKIPGGRDTCTYWTRQLEKVDLIKIVSRRPKKYRLNKRNSLIQTILRPTNLEENKFRDSAV